MRVRTPMSWFLSLSVWSCESCFSSVSLRILNCNKKSGQDAIVGLFPPKFFFFFFFNHLKKIVVQLIYNVVLVSGVQQSDSVIFIQIYLYLYLYLSTYVYSSSDSSCNPVGEEFTYPFFPSTHLTNTHQVPTMDFQKLEGLLVNKTVLNPCPHGTYMAVNLRHSSQKWALTCVVQHSSCVAL